MRVRLLWFAWGLVSLSLGFVGSVEAQELSEEQRQVAAAHFERGSVAYERGDYTEAQAAFQAAYEITAHPDLLYNVYTAAERGGELEVAVEALEGYLRDGSPTEARREALEIRYERLQMRMAEARAVAAQAAAREEEQRIARDARLREAEQARQEAQSAEAAERESRMAQLEAAHATSDALVMAGVVTAVAAGAALLSFGVFAGVSEAEDGSLASSCGRDAGRVCGTDDLGALQTWNLVADTSWITGAALGVTAGLLVLVGEALRPSEQGDVAVLPAVGPTQAGLVLQGIL